MWRPPFGGPGWPDTCCIPWMFPGHPKPLRNFDYIGAHRYFLTWCCFGRHTLFGDPQVVANAVTQILRACEPCGMEIIAYCFMPDHLHMLVEGGHLSFLAMRIESTEISFAIVSARILSNSNMFLVSTKANPLRYRSVPDRANVRHQPQRAGVTLSAACHVSPLVFRPQLAGCSR